MSDKNTPKTRPYRNFYGRLKGKALRDSQKVYLDEDLARLSPVLWAGMKTPTGCRWI